MEPKGWGFVVEVWPTVPWRRADSRRLGTGFLVSPQRVVFAGELNDMPSDPSVRIRTGVTSVTGRLAQVAQVAGTSMGLVELDETVPVERNWAAPNSPAPTGGAWETWWFPGDVSGGMAASGTITARTGDRLDLGAPSPMTGDPRGAPVLVDGELAGVVTEVTSNGRWFAAAYEALAEAIAPWFSASVPLPHFSRSVDQVRRDLDGLGPVTAAHIAAALQSSHPGYGGGRFKEVALDTARGRTRPIEGWLAHAAAVYDSREVGRSRHQVVDGQLLIAALAEIDNELRSMLEAQGFLDALRREIDVHPLWSADAGTASADLAPDAASLMEFGGAFDSADLLLEALTPEMGDIVPVAGAWRTAIKADLALTNDALETLLADTAAAKSGGPGTSVVPELLVPAASYAVRTTGGAKIGARHLLAAALLDLPYNHPVSVALGSAPRMRASLREVIRTTSVEDAVDAWDEILLGPDQALAGGYTRDVGWPEPGQRDESDDLLDRKGEAEMFAALITDPEMMPPLAIGLFGSWGSGKSFFMKLIYRAVAAKVDGRYAQIRFNAWHYSDTNLWASLGDHLFEGLAAHVGGPETDIAAELRRKVMEQTEAGRSLEARRTRIAAERDELQRRLGVAAEAREQARSQRSAMNLQRLTDAIAADEQASNDLKTLAKATGVTDAVDAYRALAGEAAYLRDESTALASVARGKLRWTAIVAAAVLLLVAGLATLLPGGMRAWVVTAATTVSLALASAARVVNGAARMAGAARRFYARAKAAEERIRTIPSGEEMALAVEVEKAEANEAAIRSQLAETDARIAQLEIELTELSGERRLYRFLTERASGDHYRSQLGVVSMIRKDLETLVDRLSSQTTLERIVLYIDDLDRCEPPQVVAVLQAVHLICGMPRFVVVVGVDPTWLERSLRRKYGRLVEGTTPREYLEKIFQIPYVLPPMAEGYAKFVTGVAEPASLVASVSASELVAPAEIPQSPKRPSEESAGGSQGDLPTDNVITVEAGSAAAPADWGGPAPKPEPPTPDEIKVLAALGPLVRSPRAATRLVNLYRLVRTTRYVGRSSRFLGTDGHPGDYLVVSQLLAMTNTPAVLVEIMARLADPESFTTWEQLLTAPAPAHLGDDWRWLAAALIDVTKALNAPQDLEPYRTWAPRLARFTFTLPSDAARPAEQD